MSRMRAACRILLAGALSVVLTGCAGVFDLDVIRGGATTETDYDKTLGEGYLQLAEAERAEYDWRDAGRFADRAKAAFAGDPMGPEPLALRDLSVAEAWRARLLRDEIVRFQADGAAVFAPGPTADAQLAFDCWVQEIEEGHQADDISACKARLDAAIDALRAVGRPAIVVLLENGDDKANAIVVAANAGGSATLERPGEAAAVGGTTPVQTLGVLNDSQVNALFGDALAAEPDQPVRFVLYFITGTSDLTAESGAQLPTVQDAAAGRVAPRIDVVGHTDRAGAAAFNTELARERARAVADLLIEAGVEPRELRVTSFGESDNAVRTADGVPEPRNRRVEILVR